MRTWEERFQTKAIERDPRTLPLAQQLAELPTPVVVYFRAIAFVREIDGTWSGTFRKGLSSEQLALAIGTSDWSVCTDLHVCTCTAEDTGGEHWNGCPLA